VDKAWTPRVSFAYGMSEPRAVRPGPVSAACSRPARARAQGRGRPIDRRSTQARSEGRQPGRAIDLHVAALQRLNDRRLMRPYSRGLSCRPEPNHFPLLLLPLLRSTSLRRQLIRVVTPLDWS
jgi:hypothetical protein